MEKYNKKITVDFDSQYEEELKSSKSEKTSACRFNCCFCLCMKKLVAGKKRRLKADHCTLDLSYITQNIIAMGFPATNYEAMYRNSYDDVKNYLDEVHPRKYKIYNLCQEKSRQYDHSIFENRVSCYPIPDHNVPSMELIISCCKDMSEWIKKDKNNVAAVHCKAGKGRTGLIICSYLLFSGICANAEIALALFDEKRTKNNKGVTIPSQKRFTKYFEELVQGWRNKSLNMFSMPTQRVKRIQSAIFYSEEEFEFPCIIIFIYRYKMPYYNCH